MIISKQWEEIAREILKDINKGVTIIPGKGGYTQKDEKILYIVVSIRQVGRIKKTILEIDPDAFIVISDTREVVNYRIGNQPHW